MMKNSYQRNSPLSSTSFIALAFGASILLFTIDAASNGAIRAYLHAVASVAWNASATTISVLDRTGYFASRGALVEENMALKDRLALYEEQSARYRALEIQNESLREMASLLESNEEGRTVRVLSSYRTSPYGTFVIDAGDARGIKEGDLVLTPGGFVLGSVSDTDAYTATVSALFAPGNTVEVIVNDVAFDAEGRGGGNAKAEIPRGAVVSVGDAVLTPQFGGRISGIIGSIESASSSATQTLYIRLPNNLDTLRFVYVVPLQ